MPETPHPIDLACITLKPNQRKIAARVLRHHHGQHSDEAIMLRVIADLLHDDYRGPGQRKQLTIIGQVRRLCEVYAAPRLPSRFTEDYTDGD